MNPEQLAGTIAALLVVGAILKNAFPNFPNRFIPLLTWILGTVAVCSQTGQWNFNGVLSAFLLAASATGIHSGIKNTIEAKPTPPPAEDAK